MINNTSLQKWNRLAQKQLDRQFVNEIMTGLQCSPFEATAILEAVYKVYTIPSVKNYISKFKRVLALTQEGFDIHEISFLFKIAPSLAEEYCQLYQTAPAVPHRWRELESFFLKKPPRLFPKRRQP